MNQTSIIKKLKYSNYAVFYDCDLTVFFSITKNKKYRVSVDTENGRETYRGDKKQVINRLLKIFFDEWETGQPDTKKERLTLLDGLIARGSIEVDFVSKRQHRAFKRA